MTISTIKMSGFAEADLNNQTNTIVGITDPSGGSNIKTPQIRSWTTSTRPTMPFDGLSGYNTTLEMWEYYQSSTGLWVQFANSGSGLAWTVVTAASIAAVINTGYVTNRSSTPVQVELPATFSVGDRIQVMGLGSAGWNVVCNAGQTAVFGSSTTSTAGGINSDIQYSNLELKGLVADTTWSVWLTNSNPTIL